MRGLTSTIVLVGAVFAVAREQVPTDEGRTGHSSVEGEFHTPRPPPAAGEMSTQAGQSAGADGSAALTISAAFADCMTGPEGNASSRCRGMDMDDDGDVDMADYQALQARFEPFDPPWPPQLHDYFNTGCSDASRSVGGPCADDRVELTVDGRTLHAVHWDASYNCCPPDDISVSLFVEGNVLRLIETDPGDGCHCVCCYDVETTIIDLAPGMYIVEYCWEDYDDPFGCHVETIVIE